MKKYLTILFIGTVLFASCKKKDDGVEFEEDPMTASGPTTVPITGAEWVTPLPDMDDKIDALAVYEDKLFLSQLYFSNGQFAISSEYDGTEQTYHVQSLGTGQNITRFRQFDGVLYGLAPIGFVGSYSFDTENREWNGFASNPGMFNNISDLLLVDGKTIIAGPGGAGDPHIWLREGGNTEPMGDGFDGTVNALANYNGNIIAGGSFGFSGSTVIENIASWNGSSWEVMASGLNGTVWDLVEYDGKLIATGSFELSGSTACNGIAMWDGTSWSAIGGSLEGGAGNGGRVLYVHETELFVGGDFDGAGGESSPNVAKWTGTEWVSLAGGAPAIVGSIAVFEDKLYIANKFSSTGSDFLLKLQ